jgi:hypothetical protein
MTEGVRGGIDHIGAGDALSPGPGGGQPGRVRWSRRGYRVLAWLFAACLVIQIFLAGMATFVDALNWGRHSSFVHFFEYLPLPMLVLVFMARFPISLRWLTGSLLVLIAAQYATAHIGGVPSAFHPVSALALFWIATHLGQRSWQLIRADARMLSGLTVR